MLLLDVTNGTTAVEALPQDEDRIGFNNLQGGFVVIIRTGLTDEVYTSVKAQYIKGLDVASIIQVDAASLLEGLPNNMDSLVHVFVPENIDVVAGNNLLVSFTNIIKHRLPEVSIHMFNKRTTVIYRTESFNVPTK